MWIIGQFFFERFQYLYTKLAIHSISVFLAPPRAADSQDCLCHKPSVSLVWRSPIVCGSTGCCAPHLSFCVPKRPVTMMKGCNCRRNKKACLPFCLPGTFSRMGRSLITNASLILIEAASFLFTTTTRAFFFLRQKRSSSCEHCSFQSELLAAHNPNCEMCSKGPSCGRFLFNFQQVYWQNLAKSEG